MGDMKEHFEDLKQFRKDRKEKLTPSRMQKAIDELSKVVTISSIGNDYIIFIYKGHKCRYWPYSGWASGKSIKDGRGLKNLLKQLEVSDV